MKFIKNVYFDIRNGIIRHYLLYICPVIMALIISRDAAGKIEKYISCNEKADVKGSFGDVWMYIYGGMERYLPKPGNPFKFPIIWTTLLVVCLLLVLTYPTKDMLGIGSHTIVAGGSRGKWWFSKVIWNIISTLIFHGIFFVVMFFTCIISGINIDRGMNFEMQMELFEILDSSVFNKISTIPVGVILLPVVVCIALNLFQMTLTLFINPNYSFIISCSMIIGAAYLLNPAMVYNYAMPLRYSFIYQNGLNYEYGYLVALVIAVLSILVGYIRFLRYDIISKVSIF